MIDLTIGRIFTGWDWDSDLDLDVDDRIDTMSRWSVSSYRHDRGFRGNSGTSHGDLIREAVLL